MDKKPVIKIKVTDYLTKFSVSKLFFMPILKKYYDVKIVKENPDFLFYSCYGNEFRKEENCVKIFFTNECFVPNFNECDYASSFEYLNFGDRHFRKVYNWLEESVQKREFNEDEMLNRRFCNFIYSNTGRGEGAVLRQEFCKQLSKYKHIDCPGKVLNNMQTDELEPRNGDWQTSKLKFLQKYKFTIAFENNFSSGYTTEKLANPLCSYSVPIYFGNPDVVKDFNPKAFINANDYNNDFNAVINRVKELDNNPEEYLAMLREPPCTEQFLQNKSEYEKWLVSIIKKGYEPRVKDVFFNKIKIIKNLIDGDCLYKCVLFAVRKTTINGKFYLIIELFGIKIKIKIKQKNKKGK